MKLVLASAVILGSDSRETRDHILRSQIPDSPKLEGQAPVFISLKNRVAQLYPQALGSLFVASYYSQGYSTQRVRDRVTLRLAVYRQSVRLGAEPLEPHGQILRSQIPDSPKLEGQVPVYISLKNRVAQLYPQALGSLLVASYYSQGYSTQRVRDRVTLRLAVYRQSVRLGAEPLDTHGQIFFLN
jgi:hypothetical protein